MANMNFSIKSASDQDLDNIIRRLRREREAQGLILEIKRHSEPYTPNFYEEVRVSMDAPITEAYHSEAVENFLEHHGVIGMKWGVRKSKRVSDKLQKAKKEKKEWDKIAEGESKKRFLGNKSPYENAKEMSRSYDKQITKLEVKRAKLKEKGKKISQKITESKAGRQAWQEAAKTASTKRFLGNKSSAEFAMEMVQELDRDIARLEKKRAKI